MPRIHIHIEEQHICSAACVHSAARIIRQRGEHIALAVCRDKHKQQMILGIDAVIVGFDIGFFVCGQQFGIVDHIVEIICADEDREGKRQRKSKRRNAKSLFYHHRNPPISVCTSVQTNVIPAASPANRPNSLPALIGSSP